MTISELFKQYKNNISKWNELEQSLMKPNEKSAWYQDFYDTMASFQIIYDSNKDIILQITNILADMDEATADEMFNELFAMHIERYRDSEFLIYVSGKLIDYYEKNEDIPKLIHLYTLRESNMFIIGNPEVMGKRYDCSDTIKAMSYLDRYCEFDEGTRYRIWVAFYNYIARMTDFGVVDICDALDRYDQLIEVSSNPQIISLDEGCDKIANIRGYLNQAMFVCIALIDRTDMKGRERFYQYTKKYFETNAMELNSVYELPAELYACHLFNQYMEKSLDIDEAFKQMVEYIRYKNRLVQKKSEYSQDEVIQSINLIRYLTNLGKYVTNQKMVSDAVSELMYIAQSNWVKSNLIFYERMSDMLGKACISLISFDVPGIAKEKCITQLIVQRDIHVYIDAKVTAEIALAIYRAITTTDIAFFEKETSIPASRWKDFLYYSSMFHDIGRERIIGNVVVRSRPMFEQEIIRSRMHTTYGAIAMESLKGIEKYADVIKGHHTYYNLENIDEYEYDRGNSEVNPFTDIVALASYIAKETDYFWDFEKKSCKFKKLLKTLPKSKDNRFNPRVIDVLLEDEVLQTEIEKLVTQYRKDVVFDVYHNWEKIQLSQDEDSMLEGCANAYNEFRNTKDDEAIMPFLKDLEYLSVSSNEAVRNKALYIMMQYYFFMGQFEYGMSISREIEPYIKKSKNYERLIDFYSSVGRAEAVRDNTAAAFTAYLSALWFCDKTPGTDDVKNMCYLDIACIFAAKYNYARAKDYYDKCKLDCLNIDEQLQYLCMNGYCHVKLGLRERLSEIRDEIRTLIINNKSHVIYPHYVYLAVFADELGDKDGFAEALDEMAKQEIIAEDIAYYSDEMFMYIELLIKCGKVKRASELIDTYIEMCGDRKEYSSALTKLYNIKIRVIARQKGYSEISEYEERIKSAFYASIQEEALKIEEIEKRLYEEIRIKPNMRKY